jgi:pyruvate/2-oxoglutarate/acetoin dehydrogenase E1 component
MLVLENGYNFKAMNYFKELKRSMEYLSVDPRTIFLGQAVRVSGTAMRNTLVDLDQDRLIELPVAEEMQMGISLGLSLTGLVPISIYPRWNFLLLAINQLVNHVDKIHSMSKGGFNSKIIIRTSIGSERPLHPLHQHTGDFTDAISMMCPNLDVIRLDESEQIFPSYQLALNRDDNKSTLLVEYGDYYSEK